MANKSEESILHIDKWAEMMRSHPKKPGEPFTFENREFLRRIYREFSPSIKKKTLLYFGSRKIEKTEFILNFLLYSMYGFKSWNALYVIARRKQVRAFSMKRLIPAINQSVNGWLRERYISHPTGVHNRVFRTDEDDVENTLTLESSWNMAKGILGEESQIVISDESQDQEHGFYGMLDQMMTLSEYKWFVITGTARDPSSDLADFWMKSTQNLWVVTCRYHDCCKDQIFGEKENLNAMCINNLFRSVECEDCGRKKLLQGWRCTDPFQCECGKEYGPEHYTRIYKGCAFCKRPIDVRDGQWKEFNHGALFIGYRANQLIHPSISAKQIYEKMISPGYTKVEVINEILGEFWGGGERPVKIEDVLACRKENLGYLDSSEASNNVMGVDCGKPHWVTVMDADHNRILWQESIDTRLFKNSMEEAKYFMNIIDRYNVKQCVIDWGEVGRVLVRDLQEEYGDRVKSCRYTTRVGNWFQYKEKDGVGHKVYKIEVDKVQACMEVFQNFESRIYKFPYEEGCQEKADEIFKHYINPTWETPEKTGKIEPTATIPKIKVGRSGPDHFFHTLVYCHLAKLKAKKKVEIKVVGQDIKRNRIADSRYLDLIRNSCYKPERAPKGNNTL